jgi:hypothetical protein
VLVFRFTRQSLSREVRLPPIGNDRDAVPWLLALPHSPVARSLDRLDRKFLLRRLQLLQADDVRPSLFEPSDENFKPAVDAFDIIGRDLNGLQTADFLLDLLRELPALFTAFLTVSLETPSFLAS